MDRKARLAVVAGIIVAIVAVAVAMSVFMPPSTSESQSNSMNTGPKETMVRLNESLEVGDQGPK